MRVCGVSLLKSWLAPCGPFRRGQPGSPVDGVDNAARCPLTAHRLNPVDHPSTAWGGTPPQTPPRFAALRGLFEISPEARKPSGPAALRAALAPLLVGRQRAPVRVSAQGAQPGGSGGRSAPRRGAALGGGRDAASEARSPPKDGRRGGHGRPPLGGYLPRRGERHCAAMCSESTFAKMGPPGAH